MGLVPARSEVEGLATTVREFFMEAFSYWVREYDVATRFIELAGEATLLMTSSRLSFQRVTRSSVEGPDTLAPHRGAPLAVGRTRPSSGPYCPGDVARPAIGLHATTEGLAAQGVPTTVRDTRGSEIDGACGQLAAKDA